MGAARARFDHEPALVQNGRMSAPTIDLGPLQRALATLDEALSFWRSQPPESPLKAHLRSAVIQSFEFTYELAVRAVRRTLIERSQSAARVVDLSFNDLLRNAADAQLMPDALRWREWRELRNATSHAYDEKRAQAVADRAGEFATDATALLSNLERALDR